MWIGIDPSLTGTAIAAIDEDRQLDTWLYETAGAKDQPHGDMMRRQVRIERWLRDRLEALAADHQIAGIAIEGPSLAPQRMGKDHERAGLWWALYKRASMYERSRDPLVISPKQRAKYATGNGNAGKDAVMLGVCRRWPPFAGGNDEADAVTLAAILARLDGSPVDGRIPKPCLAALDKLTPAHAAGGVGRG